MSRAFLLVILALPLPMPAQTRDPRVDDLTTKVDDLMKEIDGLKQTIADQAKRITDLEKTVKALQNPPPPAPVPIPAPTPAWHSPGNWSQIKPGMSELQVTDLLGPPTTVRTAVDVRTLFYESDAKATTVLRGSVTLMDDRVTAMTPPSF